MFPFLAISHILPSTSQRSGDVHHDDDILPSCDLLLSATHNFSNR